MCGDHAWRRTFVARYRPPSGHGAKLVEVSKIGVVALVVVALVVVVIVAYVVILVSENPTY